MPCLRRRADGASCFLRCGDPSISPVHGSLFLDRICNLRIQQQPCNPIRHLIVIAITLDTREVQKEQGFLDMEKRMDEAIWSLGQVEHSPNNGTIQHTMTLASTGGCSNIPVLCVACGMTVCVMRLLTFSEYTDSGRCV